MLYASPKNVPLLVALKANNESANQANQQQSSQGLTLLNYCNSVLQQPNVDFGNISKLKTNETEINGYLASARDNASGYIKTIQPQIITNITNISSYYNLYQAVATVMPPGATEKEWLDALIGMKEQTTDYQNQAKQVVSALTNFHTLLGTDAGNFAAATTSLNAIVGGDNGVLADLNGQLDSIQSKIDGAIAGIVLSGIAIVGGAFLAAVGAVAGLVTAGTSTPLVVAGVGIMAAGIGGEVASAIVLSNLNDSKGELLTTKTNLENEVKLTSGISTAIGSLETKAGSAVQAASDMENAWSFLAADLGHLADDLQKGVINTGTLRQIFLTQAQGDVKTILQDTNVIKTQMTGVQNLVAPANTNIGPFLMEIAQKHAA
ncbi:HBL/NHE enterotoxin family protein [Rhizobium sp. Leaf262]|uniref:HBL/NHE enterotoxin family protein n=1 Tax=Rhizobium sp. Leaf262 TaxID=1736312 RepID=UPI00071295EB|nr:HBL/NHE enterotoxin family protein [Rhizobium sp. Leaf262]KQO75108.1 hypothetical protein ASF29_14520 [Rhizobium sp. Leaf262]